MELKYIIGTLIDYSGLNAKAFSEKLGMGRPQGIYDILKGKTNSLSSSMEEKIISAFPEINKVWLRTGIGEMISSESVPSVSYTHGVPYYDVDFIGGFDIVINDQTTKPDYMIDFKPYEKATCWCNITGHSMEPEINHGDIIALREIKDISFLPFGEIYAIITTNGMRTVKRLAKSDNPECYMLIPTNKSPEYGEQELPKKYIERVYHVLGCIKKL